MGCYCACSIHFSLLHCVEADEAQDGRHVGTVEAVDHTTTELQSNHNAGHFTGLRLLELHHRAGRTPPNYGVQLTKGGQHDIFNQQ